MIYMGSKNRIAKHILPIILKDRKDDQYFVDVFTGGGNLIQHVDGNCIGSDINKYTISFLNKIKEDTEWIPKNIADFTKEDYQLVKNNKESFCDYELGHIGYNLSFGGKWFGGWCHNTNHKDYVKAGYEHVLRQADKLNKHIFICSSYLDLEIPNNSIIYCDPPYQKTTKYDAISKNFNHEVFWEWCRIMSEYHQVFVSEYNAPDDFECVWKKEVNMKLELKSNSTKRIEKLFVYKN